MWSRLERWWCYLNGFSRTGCQQFSTVAGVSAGNFRFSSVEISPVLQVCSGVFGLMKRLLVGWMAFLLKQTHRWDAPRKCHLNESAYSLRMFSNESFSNCSLLFQFSGVLEELRTFAERCLSRFIQNSRFVLFARTIIQSNCLDWKLVYLRNSMELDFSLSRLARYLALISVMHFDDCHRWQQS